MNALYAFLVAAVLASPLLPDRHRTSRGRLRRDVAVAAQQAPADTITPSSGMIHLAGYDKPLRSSRESIFATNRSRRTVTSLTIAITYLDAQERQLHSRTVEIPVVIPPGETRQLTFPSWDRQHAFFYKLTGKPRTSTGSPYTILATPLRLTLLR